MKAHDDLFGLGEAVDQPRQFVFQEPFPVWIEYLDHFTVADAVGGGEPEVQRLPDAEGDRLQAKLCGPVFLLGERQRVDDVQYQVAARRPLQFFQHFANPVGVVAQRCNVCGLGVGKEQVDVDRLDDGGEHVSRARRNGIEIVARQVDAQPGEQRVVRGHRRNEDQAQQHQRQGAEVALPIAFHGNGQPAFFICSTRTFAYRNVPISSAK